MKRSLWFFYDLLRFILYLSVLISTIIYEKWILISGDEDMIYVNTENVPGKKIIKNLGLVNGSTIRAKHIGRDFMAGLKNIVGGELTGYTEMMVEARKEATQRMLDNAEKLGANAVVNVRLSTASLMQGAAEVYVYGTAVIVE